MAAKNKPLEKHTFNYKLSAAADTYIALQRAEAERRIQAHRSSDACQNCPVWRMHDKEIAEPWVFLALRRFGDDAKRRVGIPIAARLDEGQVGCAGLTLIPC